MSPEKRTARIGEFFREEYHRLVGFVRARIEDAAAQDAEDFVQDVAARVLGLADITAPIENLSAYVYAALRNRITDAFRGRKPQVSMDEPIGGSEGQTLADVLQELRLDTQSEIDRRAAAAFVHEAVEELGEEERAVVVATEIEGVPFHELAESWQVPINTLLSRKSRALRKVRDRYTHRKP